MLDVTLSRDLIFISCGKFVDLFHVKVGPCVYKDVALRFVSSFKVCSSCLQVDVIKGKVTSIEYFGIMVLESDVLVGLSKVFTKPELTLILVTDVGINFK